MGESVDKGKTGITLHSVAERAGVHYSLVSRVLRGDPSARVALDKRSHILAVAKELGYVPNRVARSLQARQTRILAMLVPDITNPFHAVMFRGVEAAALARGYSVILCDTDDDDARFRQLVGVLSEGHVDGLLVASAKHDDETIDWLHARRLPFVLMNRRRESGADPWVGPDDSQMGLLGAQHLAERGHSRILLLMGDLNIDNMRRRARGFFDAWARLGLRESDVMVRSGLVSHEQARTTVAAHVPQMRSGEVTAVFALNTMASHGALVALGSAGLRWPTDVSVVGYSVSATPDITSIRPPVSEIGALATRYLMDRLDGRNAVEALTQALPVELVEAGSTRTIGSPCGSGDDSPTTAA